MEERRRQGFGGKTRGTEITWMTRHIWEGNIKIDIREVGWRAWTG
jgi:hypothetical protein